MIAVPRKMVVMLGMMSRIPVAGAIWGAMHYLIGFRRLGYEPYYVEAHGRTPSMLMESPEDDSSDRAASFIAGVMDRFDMSDNWAFHALHDHGRCYGMSEGRLKELYRSAHLLINYHGGTVPLPEHYATDRLVYLETDPVELQIGLSEGQQEAIDFLAPHCAFFSWGENYYHPDCRVPQHERFHFRPTRAPVVLDLWQPFHRGRARRFTTIGNWRQPWRDFTYQGEVYTWSKHYEFLKVLDLPGRAGQEFELALSSSSYEEADKVMLEDKGWNVCDALEFSKDLDAYRAYVGASRGEFTVAKDQNVRLRSGWFSERSAQYLAAGRPVITQETGFSNALPTGQGLFAFSNLDEAVTAVEAINADYQRHCRAATELAREYFNYDVVLKRLLSEVGN